MLKDANEIPDEVMKANIGLLLKKSALTWYLGEYPNIRSWRDFVRKFKDKYLNKSNTYELLGEIQNKTQARNESVTTYIEDMIALFRAMPTPISEEHQCFIIQRNLIPSIAMRIGQTRYTSVDTLERACKNLENLRKHFQSGTTFEDKKLKSKKGKNTVLVVSDSDETTETPSNSSTTSSSEESCNAVAVPPKKKGKALTKRKEKKKTISKMENKCWNCLEMGHIFADCPSERTRIFCFRCGRYKITTPECPNCQEKN